MVGRCEGRQSILGVVAAAEGELQGAEIFLAFEYPRHIAFARAEGEGPGCVAFFPAAVLLALKGHRGTPAAPL